MKLTDGGPVTGIEEVGMRDSGGSVQQNYYEMELESNEGCIRWLVWVRQGLLRLCFSSYVKDHVLRLVEDDMLWVDDPSTKQHCESTLL
jgi:hypothetical protein